MPIQWTKVTWYSQLIALIMAFMLLLLGFFIGVLYQQASELNHPVESSGENVWR